MVISGSDFLQKILDHFAVLSLNFGGDRVRIVGGREVFWIGRFRRERAKCAGFFGRFEGFKRQFWLGWRGDRIWRVVALF